MLDVATYEEVEHDQQATGQAAIVVIIVAFVEMLLRLANVVYAPFYALFLVGPAAMLCEDLLFKSARPPAPRGA